MLVSNGAQSAIHPGELFPSIVADGFEQVVFCHDRASGLKAIIAVHDTTLGPALGGIRMRPYPTEMDALNDVLRLARAMTYKGALAGLDLGGGKSVIIGDPRTDKSESLFRAMGRFIHSLGGRYICATDVGTSAADLQHVRAETPWVTGLPEAWGGLGDTSILTGRTVYLGMKAGAEEVWGSDSLAGKRVAVQGAGKVGQHLMEYLKEEGARLWVSDVASDAAEAAAQRFGAVVVRPDEIYDVECDVFSPNALGAVLNGDTIPRLRCRLVCGGANNQLAEDRHGEVLHERGIVYAPDYVVNAGGIISAECEILKAPRARAEAVAERVRETMRRVFDRARDDAVPTSVAADQLAQERIRRIGEVHRPFVAHDLRRG
ncbi:MAG TPA: Glu/Leu/Phe/Val dehydrogenase [Chloroflexota bacterium]|nr:Glu/Leu/Phe/Val dehydrogenase [Chloroflexota bacterium]